MSEHIYDNSGNLVDSAATLNPEPKTAGTDITIGGILSRVDAIIKNTEHLTEAIKAMSFVEANDVAYGSNNAGKKCEAIKEAVRAREETNREVIGFLRSMYEDTKFTRPQSSIDKSEVLSGITEALRVAVEHENSGAVSEITDVLRGFLQN